MNKEQITQFKELATEFIKFLDQYNQEFLASGTLITFNGCEVKDGVITIVDDCRKTSELMDECRSLFPTWSYWNNEELDDNFPAPKKPTSRKFAYTQEPDEKYRGWSADKLKKKGIECMTFRERIIFELEYFKREGKHLDIKYITLCAGSRFSDGSVPYSYLYNGEFHSYWYNPHNCADGLGPRPVVS